MHNTSLSSRFAPLPSGHKLVERSCPVSSIVNAKPFVEVTDLRKTYQGATTALDGVSLNVQEGEILGLIGPNGAGKTTLMGCMLGLLRPDSGVVRINGKPVDFISVRRITGYVPERPDFEYWMTARQFLLYHHGLAGCDRSTAGRDVEEALALVELQPAAWNRRLKTYSRGMLQRLNLAQLVIGKPKLMLLDEPTLGLDPTGVAVVRNIVNSMRASGATAIINSHQLDEIERLCDRVAFIRSGKIACIESMRAGEICAYVLCVRWAPGGCADGEPLMASGNVRASIDGACLAACARLIEQSDGGARFMVPDKRAAAVLIKELVERGLLVEEAIPERMRLEQLFAVADSADSGLTA